MSPNLTHHPILRHAAWFLVDLFIISAITNPVARSADIKEHRHHQQGHHQQQQEKSSKDFSSMEKATRKACTIDPQVTTAITASSPRTGTGSTTRNLNRRLKGGKMWEYVVCQRIRDFARILKQSIASTRMSASAKNFNLVVAGAMRINLIASKNAERNVTMMDPFHYQKHPIIYRIFALSAKMLATVKGMRGRTTATLLL
jgi:hypothetical protein